MRLIRAIAACALAAGVLGLAAQARAAMTLSTTDFKADGPIPPANIYTRCGGQNLSPELAWSDPPNGTQTLALTVIDLDVKPDRWSHWILVDLPPGATSLRQGVKTLPAGAHAVPSNFGPADYAGPCPPAGSGVHHYQITVWALPKRVEIKPDQKATELEALLSKAALDHASIVGTVER